MSNPNDPFTPPNQTYQALRNRDDAINPQSMSDQPMDNPNDTANPNDRTAGVAMNYPRGIFGSSHTTAPATNSGNVPPRLGSPIHFTARATNTSGFLNPVGRAHQVTNNPTGIANPVQRPNQPVRGTDVAVDQGRAKASPRITTFWTCQRAAQLAHDGTFQDGEDFGIFTTEKLACAVGARYIRRTLLDTYDIDEGDDHAYNSLKALRGTEWWAHQRSTVGDKITMHVSWNQVSGNTPKYMRIVVQRHFVAHTDPDYERFKDLWDKIAWAT